MRSVRYIAYRVLTPTDFFNIYKPRGTEQGGSGQLYIDFPTASVSREDWRMFFRGVAGVRGDSVAHGPRWRCRILSIGLNGGAPSDTTITQRREQSFCIANQNINVSGSERIPAWHPDNGFPPAHTPVQRRFVPNGLTVFLVRTTDGEVWAGWFDDSSRQEVSESGTVSRLLQEMLHQNNSTGRTGFLRFKSGALFLLEDERKFFFSTAGGREDGAQIDLWFDEEDTPDEAIAPETRERTRSVRRRNRKAVRALKELYGFECQITRSQFVFEKENGERYVEAHHLVPLGEGGADHPWNIVVVSGHIHRMLHYAVVEEFTLDNIRVSADGWGQLEIVINGETYTIQWHPHHMAVVERFATIA